MNGWPLIPIAVFLFFMLGVLGRIAAAMEAIARFYVNYNQEETDK